MSSFKQVVIVNAGLDMPPGKMAAQCVHACFAVLRQSKNTKWLSSWNAQGEPVIILGGGLDIFQAVEEAAAKLNVPCAIIYDAGLTCVKKGSITALALGPAPNVLVNLMTDGLPLL